MARGVPMAGIASVVLLFTIQAGVAFPRVLRQLEPTDGLDTDGINRRTQLFDQQRGTPERQVSEFTTELSAQEIKEDVAKIAELVEQEVGTHGRVVTKEEMEEIEKQLEELPWYRRLEHWLHGAYRSAKNTVKGWFSKRQVGREGRGYPDFYGYYSN